MQLILLSLVILLQNLVQQPIGQNEAFIFEDPSNTMNVTAIHQAFINGEFERLETRDYNPGFTKSTFWLALRLHPQEVTQNYYYVIGNPHINWINFFEVENNQARLINETGDHMPYDSRPIYSKKFAFPIQSSADTESLYFVEIDKHHESLQISQQLLTVDAYHKAQSSEQLISGIFMGMVILLVLFGVFLFATMADVLYLFYAAFILSGFLWVSTNLGLGYQLWWPDFPMFENKARPIFSCAQAVTALLFIQAFLKLKKQGYIYYINITLVYIGLAILLFFAIPVDYSQFPELVLSVLIVHNTWNLLLVVQFLFICIKESLQANRNAWFFLLAFTVLIAFSIIELLAHTGTSVFSDNYLAKHGVQTGYMITSVILTFGLVYRFNTYKKDQERLLQNINRQQQQHSEQLREIQENERNRIAEQLHNDVGSMLSVASLQLSSIKDANLPTDIQQQVNTAEDIIHQVNSQILAIGHLLVPFHLQKLGFAAAISYFCDNINHAQTINLEYKIIGFENMDRYKKPAVIDLYRIAQELLSNIVQHSSAKNAFLQIIEHESQITIVAEDNGSGIKTDSPQAKEKKLSISSKINYFNGQIDVLNKKEGGVLIYIRIPSSKLIQNEN